MPECRVVLRLVVAALAFRMFSALLALWCNVAFPLYQPPGFTMFGTPSPFWDAFTRYDSGWYYQIARYGYGAGPVAYAPGGRSGIAFFPVYPLLMRQVGRLFGRSPSDLYLGGIIVSWGAFVGAVIALYYLARLDLSRSRSRRAVTYAAIFPFAFFFGVVYTESTFLLFTVASFYFFRTRHWIAGGIAGGVAAATRVNGILALPALAWVAWRGLSYAPPVAAGAYAEWRPMLHVSAVPNTPRDTTSPGMMPSGPPAGTMAAGAETATRIGRSTRERIAASVGLLFVAAGVGAYSFYIYGLTGNPLEWASALQRWGYHPGGAPWLALGRLVRALVTHPYAYLAGERMAPYDTLNGLTALVLVAATPFVWRRFGAGYGLYMVGNLWLPLSSGQYEGLGRYCAVMFPFFIWLASIRSGKIVIPVVVIFATLYLLCLALFTTVHPLF